MVCKIRYAHFVPVKNVTEVAIYDEEKFFNYLATLNGDVTNLNEDEIIQMVLEEMNTRYYITRTLKDHSSEIRAIKEELETKIKVNQELNQKSIMELTELVGSLLEANSFGD